MTLPAVAAERRRLQHGPAARRPQLWIDIGAQQETRRPPLLSIDGTDRRTDTRPKHSPSPRTMRAATVKYGIRALYPASSTDCFRRLRKRQSVLVRAILVHPAHYGFLATIRYRNALIQCGCVCRQNGRRAKMTSSRRRGQLTSTSRCLPGKCIDGENGVRSCFRLPDGAMAKCLPPDYRSSRSVRQLIEV